MPYSKTTWKDRSVERPMRFTLQDNGDGTHTLVAQEGTIVEPGTPITASLLNNMELGIEAAVRKTENQDLGGFTYSNQKIVLAPDKWAASGAGLDINNSDIIGCNAIFMKDSATSDAEAIQWAKSTTPPNSTNAADYDSLRVLDGVLYLNGDAIGVDASSRVLWTGGYYLTQSQVITPSKPLQSCANGWILIWSDYDSGTSTNNNFDYVATIIPKNAFVYDAWHQALMCSYSTATQVTVNSKQFAYTNTTLWGADINNSANAGNINNDVVLRWVVEF